MIIKKKDLINLIESLNGFKNPDINLEQYTTDAISTVDFLYFVEIDNNDIVNNIIIDLGAGTGRICIGALYMSALGCVAIEKDIHSIEILKYNLNKLNNNELKNKILIIQEDIEDVIINQKMENLNFLKLQIKEFKEKLINYYKEDFNIKEKMIENICIMNPPFGIHKRNVDCKFIEFAMFLSDKIYSIHLSNEKSRKYLKNFIEKKGWIIDQIISQKLLIKGTYKFHKKPQKFILVDIYKIIKKN